MHDTAMGPDALSIGAYSIYADPPRQGGGWRPGVMSVSLMIGLVTLVISGLTVADKISELPDIDTLFTPQIVQTAATTPARGEALAVLSPADASQSDIDLAPTPPVYIQPYPSDATTIPASYPVATAETTGADTTDNETTVEMPAPVMTHAEAAAEMPDDDGALASALARKADDVAGPGQPAPVSFSASSSSASSLSVNSSSGVYSQASAQMP